MKTFQTNNMLAFAGVMLLALVRSASAATASRGGMLINPSSRSSNRWTTPLASSSFGRRPMGMAMRRQYYRPGRCAAQMGGDVVTDTVFGGFHNFLSLYNLVLTGRILLSWFPNVARQPVFEPLFVVTNPFFNIFRGLIPPIGGIDLSPLPAFFLLSFLTNATESLGAELPSSSGKPGANQQQQQRRRGQTPAHQMLASFKQNAASLRLPRLPTFPSFAAAANRS